MSSGLGADWAAFTFSACSLRFISRLTLLIVFLPDFTCSYASGLASLIFCASATILPPMPTIRPIPEISSAPVYFVDDDAGRPLRFKERHQAAEDRPSSFGGA